jgi:hypothetical protein
MGFKAWIRKNIRAFLQTEPELNESYIRNGVDIEKIAEELNKETVK